MRAKWSRVSGAHPQQQTNQRSPNPEKFPATPRPVVQLACVTDLCCDEAMALALAQACRSSAETSFCFGVSPSLGIIIQCTRKLWS
jgi:hypothetical protein